MGIGITCPTCDGKLISRYVVCPFLGDPRHSSTHSPTKSFRSSLISPLTSASNTTPLPKIEADFENRYGLEGGSTPWQGSAAAPQVIPPGPEMGGRICARTEPAPPRRPHSSASNPKHRWHRSRQRRAPFPAASAARRSDTPCARSCCKASATTMIAAVVSGVCDGATGVSAVATAV